MSVNIQFHRDTDAIGGTSIEVVADSSRIILDLDTRSGFVPKKPALAGISLDETHSSSIDKAKTGLKQILLIGVGGAGINMAKGMLDHSFSCDRHLFVGSSKWIKELPDSERLYFEYENDDEAHSASVVRDNLQGLQKTFLREKFKGMDSLILTVGLGGVTGGYSSLMISEMAVEAGLSVIVLVTMPFSFEGGERQMKAEGQLQLLRKDTQLMLIPNDIMFPMASDKKTLEAFDDLNRGLASFMNVLIG